MTDLAGRTFLVTGRNSGIGYATAADLARRRGLVHIPCPVTWQGRGTA
jgi:NAD(P)-dependent dehydrogenase (short-subunit alcohol dehydrogenase family)